MTCTNDQNCRKILFRPILIPGSVLTYSIPKIPPYVYFRTVHIDAENVSVDHYANEINLGLLRKVRARFHPKGCILEFLGDSYPCITLKEEFIKYLSTQVIPIFENHSCTYKITTDINVTQRADSIFLTSLLGLPTIVNSKHLELDLNLNFTLSDGDDDDEWIEWAIRNCNFDLAPVAKWLAAVDANHPNVKRKLVISMSCYDAYENHYQTFIDEVFQKRLKTMTTMLKKVTFFII